MMTNCDKGEGVKNLDILSGMLLNMLTYICCNIHIFWTGAFNLYLVVEEDTYNLQSSIKM